MTPSWYDVLDLDPTATDDEVRAAWKASIADLDPSDRRFRLRNQAAEVLLDPARRAAYDASLAESDEADASGTTDGTDAAGPDLPAEVAPDPAEVHEVHEEPGDPADASPAPTPADEPARPGAVSLAKGDRVDDPGASPVAPPARRPVRTALLAGLAALTALLLAASAFLWVVGEPGSDADVEDATVEAQSAAEQAVEVILAFDYRTLDQDAAAAKEFLTPGFSEEYDRLFAVIEENAPGIQTVITAEVVSSSVERAGAERASFLLFVNRPTSNSSGSYISRDQVTVTMERVGDEWLVDDFKTSPPAA